MRFHRFVAVSVSCCSSGTLAGALRSAGSCAVSSQFRNDCFAISRLASFWTYVGSPSGIWRRCSFQLLHPNADVCTTADADQHEHVHSHFAFPTVKTVDSVELGKGCWHVVEISVRNPVTRAAQKSQIVFSTQHKDSTSSSSHGSRSNTNEKDRFRQNQTVLSRQKHQ